MKTISANTPYMTARPSIGVYAAETPVTVSYSVNGSVFTDCDKKIEDNNGVVVNIPLGIYLKFDKEVGVAD